MEQTQQKLTNIQPARQKPAGVQPQAANTILARLIHLSVAALGAESPDKAGNLIVNQIHTLVKTDRAMLVPVKGKKRIFCISGDMEVCKGEDHPYSQAVHEIRKNFRKERTPQVITRENLPSEVNAPNARKVLEAVGGTNILWFPLLMAGNQDSGFALWLERWNSKPWAPEEIKLLSHGAMFFGHALSDPRSKRADSESKKNKWWKKLLSFPVFILLISLIPMNARISTPVEVIPDKPYYVFAPFDGIMEELEVQPGEQVKKGDTLFRYDTRVLEKQMEEARRGVVVARAELARLEGAAYDDKDARARIPVQKLEVERAQAEVRFLQSQLELSEVKSGNNGVVVLDDPDTLIGAPLQTGQMVLRVADPERTKLRLEVPVTDAGIFKEGDPVFARMDADPLESFPARVKWIGFDVTVSSEEKKTPVPSVLVEAVWEGKPPVIPGQRGRASIHGKKTVLGMVWFRRALTRWRNRFGMLGI
ncbi:efflux RND transporter periplasmic adaptor subunit [Desulfonema magnum]|uniref:RND efflux transporter domain-containing protein n=1 Tax=Desulfonema magnum TaxID=45655 RepID=A0A975BLE8_9BACT|nr:HlyD family efflux transporter periplasmic adaptor subunit [Desulfonema magnum]QTA87859.1 RND efflux transporter domain-containing protein [Desulfonema magnum]